MTPFVFMDSPQSLYDGDTLVLKVQRGLADKDSLLRWYATNLRLPEYFGFNWDAFDECLRDLSWINERRLAIYHEDIPPIANRKDQATYLDILAYAVADWKNDSAHEIVAVFHSNALLLMDALHFR